MMRLTVHLEDALFVERERQSLGKDLQGNTIFKPKKSKCIVNTLSFRNLKTEKDVLDKLTQVRSNYKIAKFKDKKQHTFQNGKEMIYVSYC
tara:strand:+ start:13566 stop:13838 length:273 start_codon:yes stop_codon:yes gene_type:complete